MAGTHPSTAESVKPLLVVLAGPTASGKTELAIRLALHFGTEILSADSRQCYREMNIGVARPSEAELARVPHHFIASHSIHQPVTAADYEAYGLQVLEGIFARVPVAVVTGGTGLYIRALCEGVDPMPEIPDSIRDEVRTLYEQEGIGALRAALQQQDPEFSKTDDLTNPQRMMRALEVLRSSGYSIRQFQHRTPAVRPFDVLYTGLNLEKQVLHERINRRVDQMMQRGLLDEVRQLMPYRHLSPLQTVGYQELFEHLDGKCTLQQAVANIQLHTRQYAKRQLTWFRRVAGMHWFSPEEASSLIALVDAALRLRQGGSVRS